jgi:hypothetical protein
MELLVGDLVPGRACASTWVFLRLHTRPHRNFFVEGGRMSVQTGKAMRAAEAGRYLAERLRLDRPFDAQTMWRFARRRDVPSFKLRRSVLFYSDALDRFVAEGGTPRAER